MLASVTRLHIRSVRFILPFMYHASRSTRQARTSPGCIGVRTRKTQGLAFWTLTLWDGETSMRTFLVSSAHRAAMPRLAGWCNEAAVVHWELESQEFPTWAIAAGKLVNSGRLARVLNPSEAQRSGRISAT